MTMLRCSCPECNCGMRFLADAPRVCAACWHDLHDPWDARSRELWAARSTSRSGAQGSQSRLAVGTPLAPSSRRPRTGENAAADDSGDPAVQAHFDALRGWAPGEITEAFGK